MKKTLLMFFTLSIGLLSFAQNSVVLCEAYNEEGKTTGVGDIWYIQPDGAKINIVYKQEELITEPIQLQINKLNESTEAFSTYTLVDMVTQEGKNWAVNEYQLIEAGKYQIIVMLGKKELAINYFEISILLNSEEKSYYEIDMDNYYRFATTSIGTSISSEGKLEGKSNEFILGDNDKLELVILVTNESKFATDKLIIELRGYEDNPIDEFMANVDPNWDEVNFPITFSNKGFFYIDIFTEDYTFINYTSITIK
ncbi:MAG: hypothetical protein IPG60_10875 [Bacteroidetes bacterium]|nr:hypothetical protein [Bacteroidota bacterium]MBP7398540.1 hypothetical protein [Chitinophagales bacterium]MBK7109465.1 hypothetical protein [Bacteroidota bacterium]MBK8487796.1 hypothetical protein [Bacteroidota bacterium]MBK8682449.1 hypothetical protein [Bacteroidota bacterium]